jgi:7,8-dihydropterin-6-yl-methyl-4-(beta-D-ribofuranosyl)aminobenzene 5'-phosphate synthase
VAAVVSAQTPAPRRVKELKITVLSTMLAVRGIGEWGFSALVEADGRRILFDTGAHPDTVLRNAEEMKIDLAGIPDVILSHNHTDHTAGLARMRHTLRAKNPTSLSRAHVAPGIFWQRQPSENEMIGVKAQYELTGAQFVEHAGVEEIFPGTWLTGPVPRVYPEKNWSLAAGARVVSPQGPTEDTVPEDQSMVFDTDRGLVVLSGCGHAGMINTLEYARKKVRNAPVHAAIGGFHLFDLSDEKLRWTAGKLREFELANLLAAHCSGIEPVYKLREFTGLTRKSCVVAPTGAVFTLKDGIAASSIRL